MAIIDSIKIPDNNKDLFCKVSTILNGSSYVVYFSTFIYEYSGKVFLPILNKEFNFDQSLDISEQVANMSNEFVIQLYRDSQYWQEYFFYNIWLGATVELYLTDITHTTPIDNAILLSSGKIVNKSISNEFITFNAKSTGKSDNVLSYKIESLLFDRKLQDYNNVIPVCFGNNNVISPNLYNYSYWEMFKYIENSIFYQQNLINNYYTFTNDADIDGKYTLSDRFDCKKKVMFYNDTLVLFYNNTNKRVTVTNFTFAFSYISDVSVLVLKDGRYTILTRAGSSNYWNCYPYLNTQDETITLTKDDFYFFNNSDYIEIMQTPTYKSNELVRLFIRSLTQENANIVDPSNNNRYYKFFAEDYLYANLIITWLSNYQFNYTANIELKEGMRLLYNNNYYLIILVDNKRKLVTIKNENNVNTSTFLDVLIISTNKEYVDNNSVYQIRYSYSSANISSWVSSTSFTKIGTLPAIDDVILVGHIYTKVINVALGVVYVDAVCDTNIMRYYYYPANTNIKYNYDINYWLTDTHFNTSTLPSNIADYDYLKIDGEYYTFTYSGSSPSYTIVVDRNTNRKGRNFVLDYSLVVKNSSSVSLFYNETIQEKIAIDTNYGALLKYTLSNRLYFIVLSTENSNLVKIEAGDYLILNNVTRHYVCSVLFNKYILVFSINALPNITNMYFLKTNKDSKFDNTINIDYIAKNSYYNNSIYKKNSLYSLLKMNMNITSNQYEFLEDVSYKIENKTDVQELMQVTSIFGYSSIITNFDNTYTLNHFIKSFNKEYIFEDVDFIDDLQVDYLNRINYNKVRVNYNNNTEYTDKKVNTKLSDTDFPPEMQEINSLFYNLYDAQQLANRIAFIYEGEFISFQFSVNFNFYGVKCDDICIIKTSLLFNKAIKAKITSVKYSLNRIDIVANNFGDFYNKTKSICADTKTTITEEYDVLTYGIIQDNSVVEADCLTRIA